MMANDGPNLYLLGAPRAGSTYLYSAIGQSPDVFAPPIKEPHFHLRDHWCIKGPENEAFTTPIAKLRTGKTKSAWGGMETDEAQYRALFAPGGSLKFRLEGTPNYFREPDLIGQDIVDFVDDDVFAIATLRDPVDRVLSHYRLFKQLGWETLGFEDALNAGPDRVAQGWAGTWDYLRYSEYAEPAQKWARLLGDRFRVVSYDDLAISPHGLLTDIADWLGVATNGLPSNQFNTASRLDSLTRQEAEQIVARTGRIDLDRERAIVAGSRLTKLSRPLVTVGMPVRNGAQGIANSIASLRAQTYENIEIVVCDNASTDETGDIVREIAKLDARVKLVEFTECVDIRQSYERAITARSGEYFMFAPSDDRWAEDFIASAVGRLQGNPYAALCCGRIELFDDHGNTWSSGGLKKIRGHSQKRWRLALLQMDASRIYGLIRSSALKGVFPDDDPEGWDHYAAAKLALHGDVEVIEMTAMYRHQTPMEIYKKRMFEQEPSFWGRIFFMRHIAQMFRNDPEIDTHPFGAKLALWGFVLAHANLALRGQGLGRNILRLCLNRSGRLCAKLAKVLP